MRPPRSLACNITQALRGRWVNGKGMACCPAHDDHNPSLSLADGYGGRLLLHCFAGCSYAAVRERLDDLGLLPAVNYVWLQPAPRKLRRWQLYVLQLVFDDTPLRVALWQRDAKALADRLEALRQGAGGPLQRARIVGLEVGDAHDLLALATALILRMQP